MQQQVSILLDKTNSVTMAVQRLRNADANFECHADVTDGQCENLVEAITSQMRKTYPAVANKKIGFVSRDSRQMYLGQTDGALIGSLPLVSESFIRGLAVVRAVRSGEVVEPLPFVELSLQIDVAFLAEKLVELSLI